MKLVYLFLSVISTCFFGFTKAHPSPRLSQHVEIFNGKSYFLNYEPKLTWTQAWSACIDEGLTLTRVNSPEHLEFLVKLVNATEGNNRAWIGATKLNRTDFVWIDTEEPLPRYIWAAHTEPNNSGGNETCVEVWNNGNYRGANDLPESQIIPYICTTVDEPPKTTTAVPSTTEEEVEITEKPGPKPCSLPGVFPDPDDCHKYHVCNYNEVGDLFETVFTCAGYKVWCTEMATCEDPAICPCSIQA